MSRGGSSTQIIYFSKSANTTLDNENEILGVKVLITGKNIDIFETFKIAKAAKCLISNAGNVKCV